MPTLTADRVPPPELPIPADGVRGLLEDHDMDMRRRLVRQPFFIAVLGLFVLSTLHSTLTTSSVPDPATAAGIDEALEMQRLADWLLGSAPSLPRSRGLSAMTPADLSAALAGAPRAFELLPPPGEEHQRRFLDRLPYGKAIYLAGKRHEVDALLVAAVVEAESRFVPDVVSPRGAVGLMQVLPATGERWGVSDLANPGANLDVGSRYLARLVRQFDGDLELALAAYNAGPAAVERYGGVPPYAETRGFVTKVLGIYAAHYERLWEAAQR